jgi:hypothetical protein
VKKSERRQAGFTLLRCGSLSRSSAFSPPSYCPRSALPPRKFGGIILPQATDTNGVPIKKHIGWSDTRLRRFLVNTLVVWPMLGLYLYINHHQPPPANTVLMPSFVPFCPAFLPLYIAMLFMTWLLPVAIPEPARFRACVRANVCAFLLVMPWWVFSPTVMPRPDLPAGVWRYVFDWIWTLDLPYNVRPCAHGIGPVVAAWFLAQSRPAFRWPLVLVVGFGLASIALIWQHRPIDIFLGIVAAAIGIIVATKLTGCVRGARPHETSA